MPNLFFALRSSRSDTLAMQLSLLENVNTSNALRPYAQKTLKTGTKAANWMASLFKIGIRFQEPSVVELKDRVRDGFSANKGNTPEHLVSGVRSACCGRLGLSETETDTVVSVKLIHEAAALYGVDDWLTPAEQAEAICQRYQEESLANLRKMIAKLSPQERADLEKQISTELESLSHEERDEILRDMKLDSLSGESLTNALLTAGGPLASMGALSAAGFGAYLALTTIIHAVATTAFGITLPFAVYTSATSFLSLVTGPIGWAIGGLVFAFGWHSSEKKLSRSIFAGLVTMASAFKDFPKPSAIMPPSAPINPEEADKAAADANALERDRLETEATAEATRKRLSLEGDRLQQSEAAQKKAMEQADNLRRRLAQSTALSEREIVASKEALVRAEDTELAERRKWDEYQATIGQLTFEKERLQRALEQARIRQESFEDGEGKRVLDLWTIHFPKMTFERQPVRWVVHRNHRDRMSLEKKLVELHSSEDPAGLSRGKMQVTGEHHLRFRLDSVECRMFYRVVNGQITVTKLATNQQCH